MKRSPRAGWRLVELIDGRWQATATDDREAIKQRFMARASAIYGAPVVQSTRYSWRHAGSAVAVYDANGTRRDECPVFPRLADGTRIDWPDAPPGPDGLTPTPCTARPAPGSEAPHENHRVPTTPRHAADEGSWGASGAGAPSHTEES